VHYEGKDYSVKVADRPGGMTAKAEMDDMVADPAHRFEVEQAAIRQAKKLNE
jgi:hypothetical protein